MNDDTIISPTKGIISYYVPTVQSLVSHLNFHKTTTSTQECGSS